MNHIRDSCFVILLLHVSPFCKAASILLHARCLDTPIDAQYWTAVTDTPTLYGQIDRALQSAACVFISKDWGPKVLCLLTPAHHLQDSTQTKTIILVAYGSYMTTRWKTMSLSRTCNQGTNIYRWPRVILIVKKLFIRMEPRDVSFAEPYKQILKYLMYLLWLFSHVKGVGSTYSNRETIVVHTYVYSRSIWVPVLI